MAMIRNDALEPVVDLVDVDLDMDFVDVDLVDLDFDVDMLDF